MTPQELKALQNLHKMMSDLERTSSDQGFSSQKLGVLKEALQVFATHENFELRKIAAISQHLHPAMTLKHYVSWIVPLERLLQKELRDDEFLVYSQDAIKNHEALTQKKMPLVFILHNLRSAFNVGSIFRTAECFGVSKIYLCGYTPLPTQTKLAKTAMGTENLIAWEEVPKIADLLKNLRQEGMHVVALETTSHAVQMDQKFSNNPTAFVFGNERFGLDPEVLELCSEVREIPLRGQKNSLNVGVAAAIATYEFSRQWMPREHL